jgi:hypothetical protein
MLQNMAEQQGLDFEEILAKGRELQAQDPSVTIPRVEQKPGASCAILLGLLTGAHLPEVLK